MRVEDLKKVCVAFTSGDPIVIYFEDGKKEEGEYRYMEGEFIVIRKNNNEYMYKADEVIRARKK